jgi:2-polyprenyl-6-methoxyphenol hydroxylase-like FAD-dependent oxidoreductase
MEHQPMATQSYQPIVIGAGPTGLAAALFLAERGIQCRIIDATPSPSATSRAQVINPRSLELLESTGVTQALVREARPIHRVRFYDGWTPMAELGFGNAHPRYRMSVLPQARTEALLTESLAQHAIHPERSAALVSFFQDEDGIEAVIKHADGWRERLHAPLMLAADGAHSEVRAALGIDFAGSGFPEAWPLYDVELDDPLDLHSAHVSFIPHGLVFLLAIRPQLWRVFGNVADPLDHLPPGTRTGQITWETAFHIGHRVARRETVGRVALAGDAAHIHSPVAARGMNLGIEDAFVFAQHATDALRSGELARIDEYGALRHTVHQQVVSRIEKLTQLGRGRPDLVGLLRRYLIPGMTRFSPTEHIMMELVTGLDHDLPREHAAA